MSVHSPLIHRTFRITIDIETTINAEPDETMDSSSMYTIIKHSCSDCWRTQSC
jgi:hypothetical protein